MPLPSQPVRRHPERGRARLARAVLALIPLLAALVAATPAAARPEPPTAPAFAAATREALTEQAPARRAPAPDIDDEPILPESRVLAIYGAPQLGSTALGERSARGAARLAVRQSRPYDKPGERPVIPALDLIGVVANSTPGPDRRYRTRQPAELIDRYLSAARAVGARLMIDIQPGRSPILDEIRFLEPWLAEPDVDVAIDPEWNVGRHGVPGRTVGSATAREINGASRAIQRIVSTRDLSPKLLVVHQFREGSVRRRRAVEQRRDVEVVLNFDGIGAPGPKIAGYAALSARRLFNGFSLFYRLDTPLMKPGAVLGLDPPADFLLYQ